MISRQVFKVVRLTSALKRSCFFEYLSPLSIYTIILAVQSFTNTLKHIDGRLEYDLTSGAELP